MHETLSGLMGWANDRMSDPNWAYKFGFWVIIGSAAWILFRSSTAAKIQTETQAGRMHLRRHAWGWTLNRRA